MTDSYTVTRHRYGVVVEGMVPLDEMVALTMVWAERGYERDIGIAWHLSAHNVCATPENRKRWRAKIAEQLAEKYPGDMPMQWLHGCNVGASSCYLFSLLCDHEHDRSAQAMMSRFTGLGDDERPYPRDADDWGRCVKMLDTCDWWDRIDDKVKAQLGPEWSQWWEAA